MITLRNLTSNIEHVVKPTVFPDGTQQVWKLPEEVFQGTGTKIIWHYENDSELITLAQIVSLLQSMEKYNTSLVMPFMPYGRQDKIVENASTFGLFPFMELIKSLKFKHVSTYDVHNKNHVQFLKEYGFQSHSVNGYIQQAINFSGADLVCFPDKGASERGYEVTRPSFHLSKKRNQATGAIEGLVCDLPLNLVDKKVLIVDDLCDAGRTFTGAAKILKDLGAKSVDLYVTHGIFSMGVHVLKVGGIDHIYTTDSFKTKATLTEDVTVFKLGV